MRKSFDWTSYEFIVKNFTDQHRSFPKRIIMGEEKLIMESTNHYCYQSDIGRA